jgi:K+-transporting ATPase KdpF subunit
MQIAAIANVTGLCHGLDLRRALGWVFRALGRTDSFLRPIDGPGRAFMNSAYWLSGIAALVIFVYLVVALFKPEYFE